MHYIILDYFILVQKKNFKGFIFRKIDYSLFLGTSDDEPYRYWFIYLIQQNFNSILPFSLNRIVFFHISIHNLITCFPSSCVTYASACSSAYKKAGVGIWGRSLNRELWAFLLGGGEAYLREKKKITYDGHLLNMHHTF